MAGNIGVYSVSALTVTLSSPLGSIDIFSGLSKSDGLSIAFASDSATLTEGLNGSTVHNINIAENGTITANILYDSPVNSQLDDLYQAKGIIHPRDCVLIARDGLTKRTYTCTGLSIQKLPEIKYGAEVGVLAWTFLVSNITVTGGI
jgi:hypothetical protein